MTAGRLKLAVLISGGGTTLKNLLTWIGDGRLSAEVVRVVSSNPAAKGLRYAEDGGIASRVLVRRDFDSDDAYSAAVFGECRESGCDYVVMGGFLKFVPIPPDFENRVVNIHPSLIPAFCGHGYYGHHVHEAVLEYGAKLSGCTVHFVDNVYDHGPIILQRAVEVQDDDTPDTLAARVFEQECRAYPEALQLLAEGKLKMSGRRVVKTTK
ncbi:MAG TPA: phosphoribosylglycinamide formyltransferase [Pirellulaceae bacterium]|nr:phosphoribosylglycinamide formyltransferase [Pirellulaceae bacterium]